MVCDGELCLLPDVVVRVSHWQLGRGGMGVGAGARSWEARWGVQLLGLGFGATPAYLLHTAACPGWVAFGWVGSGCVGWGAASVGDRLPPPLGAWGRGAVTSQSSMRSRAS